MNKEQKQEMVMEIIESSRWIEFSDFAEFAANENEGLMNELETTFGNDWEKFADWLFDRLVEVIEYEELTTAMKINTEFDKVNTMLVELFWFSQKVNPDYEICIDEIWVNFYENALLRPTTCMEEIFSKLPQR